MRWIPLTVLCALVMTAACSSTKDKSFVQTAPATRIVADDGVSFLPPTGWWQVHFAGRKSIWFTAEGLDIDTFEFRAGLAPDTDFYSSTTRQTAPANDSTALIFRAGMTAEDVMALQLAKLVRQGAHQVRGRDIHPSQFGALRGFRFRYDFVDRDGLARQGLALGVIRSGTLDLFTFDAPSLYYFDHLRPAAESALATIRTP